MCTYLCLFIHSSFLKIWVRQAIRRLVCGVPHSIPGKNLGFPLKLPYFAEKSPWKSHALVEKRLDVAVFSFTDFLGSRGSRFEARFRSLLRKLIMHMTSECLGAGRLVSVFECLWDDDKCTLFGLSMALYNIWLKHVKNWVLVPICLRQPWMDSWILFFTKTGM